MKKLAKLKLKALLENVPRAMAFVRETAKAAGAGDQALREIEVSVDEACANVVQHAYAGVEPGDMELTCFLEGQNLVIRVRDWGQSFDPDAVPEPDVKAPLEERHLGGLGLFLIHQFMDRVEFTFRPGQGNELTMVKRIRGER